jgi:hypothetical protein
MRVENIYNLFHQLVFSRKFGASPELRRARRINHSLECFDRRWLYADEFEEARDPERPVFIFSAGWRAGSTLVQRLVVSSGEIMVWGEPLGELGTVARLADSLAALNDGYPDDSWVMDLENRDALSSRWIANFTPPMAYLRRAHRTLLLEWLKKPALERYDLHRWGLKEVRLCIDHARYLKWLFPESRFLFVYRDLESCYRSWKGNLWYSAWPDYFSYSPLAFSNHWKLLVKGFIEGYRDVDGMLIRFEDLVAGRISLDKLASHIQVTNIDEDVLKKRVGGPSGIKSKRKKRLHGFERSLLRIRGGSTYRQLYGGTRKR